MCDQSVSPLQEINGLELAGSGMTVVRTIGRLVACPRLAPLLVPRTRSGEERSS
jgi:hypothetical protein